MRPSPHFEFGRNWSRFSKSVNEHSIRMSAEGLIRLCPDIDGKSFLDIGCGSGLSSVAALRLGASRVSAIDIDEISVETTKEVLGRHAADKSWSVAKKSVFDLQPDGEGPFDIVYSWGVLHHTGAMENAIQRATSLVAPNGTLVIAIYAKTLFCSFWKVEKFIYSRLPAAIQALIRVAYIGAQSLNIIIKGSNPITYAREYARSRGMRYSTDVHDWLGGYPYESATPAEIEQILNRNGFTVVRSFLISGHRTGLGGSGCDEYVAKRRSFVDHAQILESHDSPVPGEAVSR